MDLIVHIYFLLSAYMVGLIWFVQVVHYPLFRKVGPGGFVAYEQEHTRRTGWVVAPVMIGEAVLALWLTYRMPGWFWGLQLGVVGLLWVSTFAIQVPLHGRLSVRWDEKAALLLVRTNWLRTALWTLKSLLLLGWREPV